MQILKLRFRAREQNHDNTARQLFKLFIASLLVSRLQTKHRKIINNSNSKPKLQILYKKNS